MRWLALLLALVGCRHGSTPHAGDTDTITVHTSLATDDDYKPTYEKAELQRVLSSERSAVATAESRAGDLEGETGDAEQLQIVRQDLAVRRRFVASLEACEANLRVCPPRLDEPAWSFDAEKDLDPQLEAPLRFDVASWQKVAAELHGRACACRTFACVDTLGSAIDRLEQRPMPDVQADDTAALSIVRARECLFRLRGKKATPRPFATD